MLELEFRSTVRKCLPVTILIALALVASVTVVLATEPEKPVRPFPDVADYDSFVKETDREHWSFQPVAPKPIPGVKQVDWVRNPIDAFVLAKLEAHDWKPNPPATAGQLIRRMSLDLTGLPPTLEEQSAADRLVAVSSEQSKDDVAKNHVAKNDVTKNDLVIHDDQLIAMDRMVDELLTRPAYGERWGRHWLDLVRFAETNGYERDGTKPHVWRYRDYVIQAFNSDKPYDRFILEQLAGDELPDANSETVIATGYYRLGPWDDCRPQGRSL